MRYGSRAGIHPQGVEAIDAPLVLTALQHGRHLGSDTAARYSALATRGSLVAVFGVDLAASGVPHFGADRSGRMIR